MRGWYNIHDHEKMRMGFVPFKGSSKSGAIAAPDGVEYAVNPNLVEATEVEQDWEDYDYDDGYEYEYETEPQDESEVDKQSNAQEESEEWPETGPWVVEMKGWLLVSLLIALGVTIGLFAAALVWYFCLRDASASTSNLIQPKKLR